jgi:LuxR family maltose regulon positive regulatory protein
MAAISGPTPVLSTYYDAELALPRLLLARNTPESRQHAREELTRLCHSLTATRQPLHLIAVLAMQAILYDAERDYDAADDALTESVRLAQPGGFIRTFVDLGPGLINPLRRLAHRNSAEPYIREILEAFPAYKHAQSDEANADLLIEPLTRREMEVIMLLGNRLSNKEIAEVLVIAPTTAKRHTINIYQKLGVSGRREAVERATELGLL